MMEQTDTGIILHDLDDRISGLPDPILGVILSFLPTKEAVATGFLSKRWKFLWRTVHNLDFYQDLCSEEDDRTFIEFVDLVLDLHDAGSLHRFSLRWGCDDVCSHTDSWINTALTKNVHRLFLSGYDDDADFDLPVSVFRCDSLQSLKVNNMGFSFPDTLVVCLPKLESLRLDKVFFSSEEAIKNLEDLISRCPVLNDLRLGIIDVGDAFKCRISSASLRRLDMDVEPRCSLTLNAASLEYLHLGDFIWEIIIEKSLSSLVEAHLDVTFIYGDDEEEEEELVFSCNSIVEAIHAFNSAKVMTLSDDSNKVIEFATISLSTEFKRLEKLVCILSRSLKDIIGLSDNLEVLEIHEEHYYDHFTLVEVPRCFSTSLKKVELYYNKCDEDDCEMIRFMLEHGSKLEDVNIACYKYDSEGTWDRNMLQLSRTILEFPRKSPVCKVHILKWCYDDGGSKYFVVP